jgi:N-acetylmuramoyl-L-alanine amidase
MPLSNPTGADMFQLASTRVGQPYIFGALVPKDNPNWKGPWDCAELISWALFQVAGMLYGCANDSSGVPSSADAGTVYWDRDAKRLGKIISVADAANTPGAAIIRLAQAGGPGGHIVFSDGNGGTVEAHSHADGVIKGSLAARRWDYGILVPGIAYSTGTGASAPSPVRNVVRIAPDNMSGPVVKAIQSALKAAGFDPGKIDGKFGPHTTAAVVAFQNAHGLAPDGEVGKLTAAALQVDLAKSA